MDKEKVKAMLNEVVAKAKAAMLEIKDNFKADEDATGARKIQSRFVNLWKSGITGRVAMIASSVVVLLLLFSVFCGGGGSDAGTSAPVAKSAGPSEVPVAEKLKMDQSGKPGNDALEVNEKIVARSAEDIVKEIFALAKKSAEADDNLNFYGFFVGMSRHDAKTLCDHYQFKKEDCSFRHIDENSVWQIRFSLKAVRRITKRGNTFDELLQAVVNRVGSMKEWVNESTGQHWYEYKTIDGLVVTMSESHGLVIKNESVKQKKPMETSFAKEERAKAEVELARVKAEKAEEERKEKLRGMRNDINNNLYHNYFYLNKINGGDHLYSLDEWRRWAYSLEIFDAMVPISGRDFWIGKYEVTQEQWKQIMGYGNNPSRFENEDSPVERVSWNDCKKFIEKLNASPFVKASGLTFRLPTADEWEYACRAGGKGEYCRLADGGEITRDVLGKVAWWGGNSGNSTHPVGKKMPNAFGLFDMLGNVWEWCEDQNESGGSARLRRGDGWRSDGGGGAGSRLYNNPDERYDDLGFRLVATKSIVAQMKMCYIPFLSGKDFFIGKYEVTQRQWSLVMGDNPSQFKNPDNPVENVSWNDCKNFIEKLNAMPEVKASGLIFRLPAETEWEYACRAGSDKGSKYGQIYRSINLDDAGTLTEATLGKAAWYKDNSGNTTHPAGQKAPNPFGLYDMLGNVWEWCEESCGADGSERVRRGGSMDNDYNACAVGVRESHPPDFRYCSIGFRLAASPSLVRRHDQDHAHPPNGRADSSDAMFNIRRPVPLKSATPPVRRRPKR